MSERQLSQTIAFVADTDRAPQRTSNTLRWADTDLNGHVTHPVFVEFFQNGRAQFLADRAWRLSPGMRWVTRHLTIDYLGEVFWPGSVEILTRVVRLGSSSSIHFKQSLLHGADAKATASAVMVLVDTATARSVAIPEAVRHLLCPHAGGTL